MLQTDQINIAVMDDIPYLELLVNGAYRGESSKKGWTTEADLLDGIRTDRVSLTNMIQNPDAVILKYLDKECRLLGCVYLQKKQAKLYLGMLTVSPELQARGIGKQLLAAAENHAKRLACTAITMTVISIRQELIAWYERQGYRATGETEPFPANPDFGLPRQPLHFIVMEKPLLPTMH